MSPEIETDRLRLRPFGPEHTDAIHRLWIDPQVRKYLWDDALIPRARVMNIIESSMASFASNGFGLWLASLRRSQALAGFCGFWLFHEPPELELVYGAAPEHWGRRLATEMAGAMLRYGFEERRFERIVASVDAPNLASIRVLEKIGMRRVRRVLGEGRETLYYAITCQEHQPAPGRYRLRPLSP